MINHNPKSKEIKWEDAKPYIENLKIQYENYPFHHYELEDKESLENDNFLFYDGDTTLDNLDLEMDKNLCIIVNGNLSVKGNIYNEETDGACSLIVLGNLHAKNICVGGQYIYVRDNLIVDEVFIGSYNHGELYVIKEVQIPVLICHDEYHINLPEFDSSVILYASSGEYEDYDDQIKELLIDEVYDDEEEFNFYAGYSLLQQGKSLLRPIVEITKITSVDFEKLLNTPLFGPDMTKLIIIEKEWTISLTKAHKNDLGEIKNKAIFLRNNVESHNYFLSIDADGEASTLYENENKDWLDLENSNSSQWKNLLCYFAKAQMIIDRKVKWNQRYKNEVPKEELWQLIWMFQSYSDIEKFKPIATTILKRVLYACMFPYAYVFVKYKEESARRGLESCSTDLFTGAVILDALIAEGLIVELSYNNPLADEIEKLNAITSLYMNNICTVSDHYKTNPIDIEFLSEINNQIAATETGIIHLDFSLENYILACANLKTLSLLTRLTSYFKIEPKYYI